MSDTSGSQLRTSAKVPWRIRLLLAIFNLISNACLRSDGTINRSLMKLIDIKVPPSDNPVDGVTSSDTTVDPSRNLWCRYFLPTAGENLPIIIFFHGGCLLFFSPSSKPYHEFCRRLAGQLPAVVVSVNYRLAPEHRFPSPYEDGFDILKFIEENPPSNADLTRCFIVGDSAGGNLGHHVTAKVAEHDFRNLKIAGAVPIQPLLGGEERTESEIQLAAAPLVSLKRRYFWSWKAFLPEGSDRDHPAANIFGPKSREISGLKFPKSLVFIGGLDPLRDWQKRYCEGMIRNGKEVKVIDYPNAIHSFYMFPELPETSLFLRELQQFIYPL